MGALTPDGLRRSLTQGAPDPVYYLYGGEDVLKDEAVRALVERAVDPGARDFNVDSRSATDLDPAAFRALVDTPPMLAATRVVVLRGVEQLRKGSNVRGELERYLESPNPTTVLILVQGAGEPPAPDFLRRATGVAAEPLAAEPLERWMSECARDLGLALAPEAAALLRSAAGHDLRALEGELAKLAAFVGSRPATREDVTALIGVRRGETLEDLVEAALTRRAAAAERLVEPVLEQGGMTGVRALTALGTAVLGTALARAELDGGVAPHRLEAVLRSHLQAARPYGLGNWGEVVRQWARWATLWSAPELRHALRRARDADAALKTSTWRDERGIIAELVLSWGTLVREAA